MIDQLSTARQMPYAIGNAFTKRDMRLRAAPLRGTPLTSITIGSRTYGPDEARDARKHLMTAGAKCRKHGVTIRMSF